MGPRTNEGERKTCRCENALEKAENKQKHWFDTDNTFTLHGKSIANSLTSAGISLNGKG